MSTPSNKTKLPNKPIWKLNMFLLSLALFCTTATIMTFKVQKVFRKPTITMFK